MAELELNSVSGPLRALRPAALRLGGALIAVSLLAGCAQVPSANDPEALAEYQEINDPIEPLNRAIFGFNRMVDTMLLRPVATLYKGVIPPVIQDLVNNFLNNLKTPVVLLNDVLQGEGERAGVTATRFVINSTVGVLGFGDPATSMGYARHGEDFGQTLGVWGAGEGPYIVLPILGPSNPRDAVGKVVDVLTDPVWHYAQNTDREYIPNERLVAEGVNFRARNMDDIDDLERTSLDYYAAVRSLYRQIRADEIKNGAPPSTNGLPAMGGLSPMDDPDAETPVLATKN